LASSVIGVSPFWLLTAIPLARNSRAIEIISPVYKTDLGSTQRKCAEVRLSIEEFISLHITTCGLQSAEHAVRKCSGGIASADEYVSLDRSEWLRMTKYRPISNATVYRFWRAGHD